MFNCSDDVLDYHDDEITLTSKDRNEMRDRRNANRDRLKRGLKEADKPAPKEFQSQGSYEMKTMTQHPNKEYDIDDGVYFDKEKLVGPRGGEMSPLEARQMVRDALDDGSFNTAPETRKNCVRVYYDAGYHVDVPVYRAVTTKDVVTGKESIHYELASSEWKRSDARDVTAWFEKESSTQSVDTVNGGQLRRITREIKKYARSRSSWGKQILSGFGITKLVTECYKGNSDREDTALHDTMKAIRDRLKNDLVVKHPVTPDETITNGDQDPKAAVLRDKLSDAITWLEPLFGADCTREQALKCWDKVFATTYFIDRLEEKEKASAASAEKASVLSSGLFKDAGTAKEAVQAVNKQGGGRYAR